MHSEKERKTTLAPSSSQTSEGGRADEVTHWSVCLLNGRESPGYIDAIVNALRFEHAQSDQGPIARKAMHVGRLVGWEFGKVLVD